MQGPREEVKNAKRRRLSRSHTYSLQLQSRALESSSITNFRRYVTLLVPARPQFPKPKAASASAISQIQRSLAVLFKFISHSSLFSQTGCRFSGLTRAHIFTALRSLLTPCCFRCAGESSDQTGIEQGLHKLLFYGALEPSLNQAFFGSS